MLILVCGPAGTGKSTEIEKLRQKNANIVVLSSDTLRGVIGRDESDQTVSNAVFRTMEHMTEYLLKMGYTVVIDATNRTIRSRANFLSIARRYKTETKAIVMQTPLETALKWNAARKRQVPEHIIRNMFKDFVEPVVGEFHYVTYAPFIPHA